MPVTQQQLERRKNHLGSSDMAAVLGLSPYASAYDIWAMKSGRLPENEENAAMRAGNVFEGGVLLLAEELYGPLIRNQYRSIKDEGVPLGANVDALVVKSGEPVEAKCVGLLGYTKEFWGDADTDQVPDRVLVQATVHMICTEQELCHVAAFIAGRGFVPFVVRRDEDVANAVKDAAVQFWQKYVVLDTPPSDSMPTINIISKLRRQPKSCVPVDTELVRTWSEARQLTKTAKKSEEEAKIKLLAALGDAEAGTCELGELTYLEQTRGEHLVKESTFRVIRFKQNKENK